VYNLLLIFLSKQDSIQGATSWNRKLDSNQVMLVGVFLAQMASIEVEPLMDDALGVRWAS